ncbi:MAG: hypothetical protein ACK58L_07460 [Planctomycetota bacterium]
MLWEFFQDSRIAQSNRLAAEADFTARTAQADLQEQQQNVRTLERHCEKLTLAVMAMAEILRDRLGIQQHEIDSRMAEIDLRDGHLDGRLRTPAAACPSCRRPNKGNRKSCLYCGAEMTSNSFLFPDDGPA